MRCEFRDAWNWSSKETAKLAQDFSRTVYTYLEIQSKAYHCLWRLFTHKAEPLVYGNILQSFFKLNESKTSTGVLYVLSPAIFLKGH